MIQETDLWWRAGAALAAVILLAWGTAKLLRRSRLAPAPGRRLRIAETLALDPRRRLVLARCDGRDVLLLVGGPADLLLGWPTHERSPCDPSS
jgi:flagellar protein FliO/FliZ